MSSSSCLHSHHVTTILIQQISETQKKDKLGSKFEQNKKKFHEKSLCKVSLLRPSHPAFEQGEMHTNWSVYISI